MWDGPGKPGAWVALGLAAALIAACGTTPRGLERDGERLSARSGEDMMARAFAIADRDGDGRLSTAETGLDRDMLAALDEDRDGAISRAELAARKPHWLLQLRLTAFMPLVRHLFKEADADRDGKLGLGELAIGLGALDRRHRPRAELLADADRARFLRHDRNADRQLSLGEFAPFYLDLGLGAEGEVQAQGLFGSIGGALVGGYLRLTGSIAAHRALHPPREQIKRTPLDYGFAYEDVSFEAEDGTPISAWWLPARQPTDKTIVLVHGFQTNRSLWLYQGQVGMLEGRYNILMPDLRNHGRSGGWVTSYGYYEHLDVRAAIAYARRRGAGPIGLAGQSLGGASVIRAAGFEPEIKAVFEDASFANVLFALMGGISTVPLPLPHWTAAMALAIANERLGVDLRDAEPLVTVNRIAPRPLMVVHGENDPFIFVDHARTLYTAYHGPKELWICPGAGHGDSVTTRPDEFRERFTRFFAETL